MATFEAAIEVVLMHEGGIGRLEADPGGETCFGWSEQECKALGISPPANAIEARGLYLKYYWNPRFNSITSQDVATKLFDDTVNQGPGPATTNLQEALVRVGSVVVVDGNFGPNTLQATNSVPDVLLLPWMRIKQFLSYERWIAHDPARQYLRAGLARRAAWPDPNGEIAQKWIDGFVNGG